MKIIIVEDDEITLRVLEYQLKKAGHDVRVAKDGKDGKELIEAEHPSLIISDILMPYVGGLELLSIVRNELKMQTPFIVMSVMGQQRNRDRALEGGANDYLTKPIDPSELLQKVKLVEINMLYGNG